VTCCQFCNLRQTSAPTLMDHEAECWKNPVNQVKVATKALERISKMADVYQSAKSVAKKALRDMGLLELK
jgi:hypothetical protein